MTPRYHCCEENRRVLVAAHPTLNGIDWLEVLDRDAPLGSPRQRTLLVRLLKAVPVGLGVENVRIEGGERIRDVKVAWVGVASGPLPAANAAEQAFLAALPEADQILVVRTDQAGDHAGYTLRLVRGVSNDDPPPDIDPRLAAVDFRFKVECPSDFDCRPETDCPDTPPLPPALNYLARDYESLRRLVIDRLAQQMPGWRDRSPADLATTLAELIAYVGDLQHYQLDAVATEAYLATARRRSSLRRHALLVDYAVHEGCNARAWVHVEVDATPGTDFALPAGVRFLTRQPGLDPRVEPDGEAERSALLAGAQVFEPLESGARLHADHNRFEFHTWGDERCCLPAGATAATLRGHWPDLAAGDMLILQEVVGPRTGLVADADPAHRQAVRLTSVRAFDGAAPRADPLDGRLITEITWHAEDALAFSLCLSAVTDDTHGSELLEDVSIALGNVVLADHGRSITDEDLGTVPPPRFAFPPVPSADCSPPDPEPLPPRFRPRLREASLTHVGSVLRSVVENGLRRSERVAFDPAGSATAAFRWAARDALPAVTLSRSAGSLTDHWTPRRDLLSSRGSDTHFVVEMEADGLAQLRFGDDTHGRRPESGSAFTARYRVGNGPDGNVGAGALAHAVTVDVRIAGVDNPLPARGGLAPESAAEVRRRAPQAFRTQERAVTPADYAEVTERLPGVQRAAARLRWTGSWHSVFVTVDREGGLPVDAAYAETVLAHDERYRMAGHDLQVCDPIRVSLEIDLRVCVADGYFRSDVRRGLLDALGAGRRRDGELGLFHPDRFTFGQTVYLSPLYAAARAVAGVVSVQVLRFTRQGQEDPKPLADGYLKLGSLEVARLDNDPNFPEHGVLRLELHGGK